MVCVRGAETQSLQAARAKCEQADQQFERYIAVMDDVKKLEPQQADRILNDAAHHGAKQHLEFLLVQQRTQRCLSKDSKTQLDLAIEHQRLIVRDCQRIHDSLTRTSQYKKFEAQLEFAALDVATASVYRNTAHFELYQLQNMTAGVGSDPFSNQCSLTTS